LITLAAIQVPYRLWPSESTTARAYLEESMIFGVNLPNLIGYALKFIDKFLCVFEDIDHISIALLIHDEDSSALAIDELNIELCL
jgi:hypothetical protein